MIHLHEEMVPLHEVHKGSQEMVKVLNLCNHRHDPRVGKKYMNVPATLVRKGREDVELDRENIKMFIQVFFSSSIHL